MTRLDLARVAAGVRRRAAGGRDRWWAARQVRRAQSAFAPPPASAYAAMGPGTVIVPPARIERPENIELGAGVLIHEHVWLMAGRGSGTTLWVGDRAMFTRFVKVVAMGHVEIGEGVSIADHSYLSDVEYVPGHTGPPQDRPLTEPRPVVVGDHAFIGVGAVIKPGVTIGAHGYVGAGSVVDQDVPPWTLVAGNPARVIRTFGPPGDGDRAG